MWSTSFNRTVCCGGAVVGDSWLVARLESNTYRPDSSLVLTVQLFVLRTDLISRARAVPFAVGTQSVPGLRKRKKW